MKFAPGYLKLFRSGDLKTRIDIAMGILEKCRSCPKNCETNRINNEYGICLSGFLPIVSSYTNHHGEEPGLSGKKGAGNIFFGNCNLKCIYCQNFEISQNWDEEKKHEVSFERLAEIMIELQNRDCHNIGLVSPTQFAPQILKSIHIAAERGLALPIIYNSNGYDSVEILKLYKDVIDIYLPDLKYGNNEYAKSYSKADKYFDYAKLALTEMFDQVGEELVYENGIVVRGLIIRHLVLPNDLSDTENVFNFISRELSPNIHISLMSQYYPANKADHEILLDRRLRQSEYEKVLELMDKYGLKNGWIQELESYNYYRPEFKKNRDNPFN
jgi:putative pyruvate formate lyase activating enzyme